VPFMRFEPAAGAMIPGRIAFANRFITLGHVSSCYNCNRMLKKEAFSLLNYSFGGLNNASTIYSLFVCNAGGIGTAKLCVL